MVSPLALHARDRLRIARTGTLDSERSFGWDLISRWPNALLRRQASLAKHLHEVLKLWKSALASSSDMAAMQPSCTPSDYTPRMNLAACFRTPAEMVSHT